MIPADETWVRAYAAHFQTTADCSGALQFPACINAPETAATIPTEMAVATFRSIWPKDPVVTLPGVGHFIQEDAPETACALIEQFIQMTP